MSGFIVGGVAVCAPGLVVRNFAEDAVHRFPSKGKRARAVELVIHETVTRNVDSTIAVLKKRGLSVHLVMGADGALTQHGDLATDILWHASQHNGPSFGVEVVNPYYPSYLKPGLPWERVIKAPWAHKGEYVLPTPAQAEAVAALVRWTTSA
ncbi:MAG: N-acetylmuramoyl-L-alanine amidase, partial [Sandaracinus sp.]|nr:N-acetylmuramoyl-L-alanine amidase [Sandaracinus sp.]